ncbi:MAG: hypothetical protein VCC19_01355 [Myxococcota bacterium]
MRRFTRRRRGGPRSKTVPIDAKSLFEKILEQGIVPAENLEPLATDEIPSDFAVVGSGEAKSGGRLLVAFSPRNAGHAVLAALAVGGRMAESEHFDGEVYVVAPEWTGLGRRVLSAVGEQPFRLTPLAAPSLVVDGESVVAEQDAQAAVLAPAQIAGHLARPADRDLFMRVSRGLEGLAAKHGGALRGYGRAVEFTLLARRVAELRAEPDEVVLVTTLPRRSSSRVTPENVSRVLDDFEGQVRKRLNDRRTRDGEEGLRSRAIAAFRNWHSLRAMVPWPLGGSDSEVIDWVGVDVEGRPVVGAARDHLGFAALAEIVEAFLRIQAWLPSVLAHAPPPVVLDAPRLVVGGREIAMGVARTLDALALTHELFEIRGRRGGELELSAIAAATATAPARERPRRQRRRRGGEPRREVAATEESDGESDVSVDARVESRSASGGRGRRRGRGGRSPRDRDRESAEDNEEVSSKPVARFEEVSLFDLDDESNTRESGGDGSRRSRGRGRGRRRGRGGSSDGARSGGSSNEPPAAASADTLEDRPTRPRGESPSSDVQSDAEGLDESFLEDEDGLELDDVEDVPELEVPPEPQYEEDDEAEGGSEDDRENAPVQIRRAGLPADAPVEAAALPRRRGAIVAHADRDSLVAALLIARDIRMVEGLWVYPQSELMTFFRAVTTDLREDTPIYVVGFTPSPAPDVLQAAALYRDRMMWFDHQEWPPEDLQALRDTIGEDAVHVVPGAGSTLPPVLELCSRRSRFTDKLVDLVAGRFSQHDYERWGRLWWWRLGELCQKTGDHRAEIELLLSGRPSDLAREAEGADTPPIPPEVEYVSKRDFRLVHFAGYGLVVVEVPPELDLHLTARVVRERYDASLSLAHRPGSEHVVFAGDELAGRRSLDLGRLVEHICNKLEWVEQLPDTDHVTRVRVRDWGSHPGRLDDIVAEIAMGRSLLER